MEEIWKDIEGYEGLYQVSNLGRVKSLDRKRWNGKVYGKWKGRFITIRKDVKGYCTVKLNKNGKGKTKLVHRLVAESFIKKEREEYEVNHIDGNKCNNNVDNLEWCSHSYNAKHAWDTGLNKYTEKRHEIMKNNHYRKGMPSEKRKKVKCIETGVVFNSIAEAAEKLSLQRSKISNVINGYRKTTGGFHFEYIEG